MHQNIKNCNNSQKLTCVYFVKIPKSLDLAKITTKTKYPGRLVAARQRSLLTWTIMPCVHKKCEYLAGLLNLENGSSLTGLKWKRAISLRRNRFLPLMRDENRESQSQICLFLAVLNPYLLKMCVDMCLFCLLFPVLPNLTANILSR